MLAQVFIMVGTWNDIPQNILNNIDKMGMNECLILTELEGEYFNILYNNAFSQTEKKEFDMRGKKVGFFTGNAGSIKSNKKKYFSQERLRMDYNDRIHFGTLYIFDTIQKEKSGGYDAAIVDCSSKKPLTIKEVVKQLKENR